MLPPILLPTRPTTKSDPCWEHPSWLITAKSTRRPPSSQTSTLPSNQMPPGPDVSTPSEISSNADPAGLSLDQKLFQTDSVFPPKEQSTLSSPQKTWLLATRPTSDAMVATLQLNGSTSRTKVSVPMLASPTPQVAERLLLAEPPVLMAQPRRDTHVSRTQLSRQPPLPRFSLKSRRTDPWKPDSPYMLTS